MKLSRVMPLIKLACLMAALKLTNRRNAEYKTKQAIFKTFSELGGIYLKFLQMLALSSDFMRGWSGPAELSVFEAATYDNLDIKALLERELGIGIMGQFKEINPEPFAAGSFAQVYKATLLNDQEVVLKVLRPSLLKTLRSDLRLLGVIVKLTGIFKPTSIVDTSVLFADFKNITLKEIDYLQEARATEWFYEYFRGNNSVVIPKVYPELSNKHLITQDYIGGISLAELLAQSKQGQDATARVKQELGSDFWHQLYLLGTEMVHATLWSDYLLGDPHPGNIRLLPGNRIGVIDFGIVAESPPNKQAYLALLKNYRALFDDTFNAGSFMLTAINFFDEDLANSISTLESYRRENGRVFNQINATAISGFSDLVKRGVGQDPINNKKIIKIFSSLINDGNRYGLRLNTQSASMMKAARTYVQLLRQFSMNGEDHAIMGYILNQETEYASKNAGLLDDAVNIQSIDFDKALEIISEWLSQIADKDPSLYSQLNLTRTPYYA